MDNLDDAFIWGKNDKTYFFYQNLYWRYNEATKTMDSGYPQDISRWGGVGIKRTKTNKLSEKVLKSNTETRIIS